MVVLDLANYPLSITTTIEPDWGIVADYADDGTLHRRELYGAQRYIINADWGLLDLPRRTALEDILQRNRLETFQIDFDGHRYTAELITPPARRYISGALYGVTAIFRGTRSPWVHPIAEILAAYPQASHWFDPSDLSTVWEDVAGTIPARDGSLVARLDDKGNLGLHAVQTNAANRPVLQRDAGGRWSLLHSGNQWLVVPTGMPVPTTGSCAVAGWMHTGYGSATPIIYYSRGITFDANHRHPLIHLVSDNWSLVTQFGNQAIVPAVGSTAPGAPYVATVYLADDNAARSSYLNGMLFGTATALTLGDAGDNPVGNIGGSGYVGHIYGVVHIQHGISHDHRKEIQSWMARQSGWAL